MVNNDGKFSSQFTYCKKLKDTWDIDATIKRVHKDEGAARTVNDTEFVVKVRWSVEEDSAPCHVSKKIFCSLDKDMQIRACKRPF